MHSSDMSSVWSINQTGGFNLQKPSYLPFMMGCKSNHLQSLHRITLLISSPFLCLPASHQPAEAPRQPDHDCRAGQPDLGDDPISNDVAKYVFHQSTSFSKSLTIRRDVVMFSVIFPFPFLKSSSQSRKTGQQGKFPC